MTDEELKAEWLRKGNAVKRLPEGRAPADYDDVFDMDVPPEKDNPPTKRIAG